MSKVLVTESYLSATADAIRIKLGQPGNFKPSQFASGIMSISGIADLSIGSKSVTSNGVYSPASDNLDFYSQVTVAVEPNLGSLSVSENGTYSASLASLDGYSEVVVDVPQPSGTVNISENGSYNVSSYSEAVVSVEGFIPTGSISISSNGTYDVSAYSEAVVDVPVAGSIGTLSVSQNGTYHAADENLDGYSDVTVNVAGADLNVILGSSAGAIYDNTVTSLRAYALNSAQNISSVSFGACVYVGDAAFRNCAYLASVSLPVATYIGNAFYSCVRLTSVEFPEVLTLSGAVFHDCTGLVTISAPKATTIGSSCFRGCTALKNVYMPNIQIIPTYAFSSCRALPGLSFNKVVRIESQAFYMCSKLSELYLLGSSVATLTSHNAFTNTPMKLSSYIGVFGSVYVPASLVSDYKVANNWSVIADRITAYDEPDPVLSSIGVTSLPTKSVYLQNEILSLAGVNISATYTNSSVVDVTSLCTFNPSAGDTLSVIGSQVVTVAYTESDVTKTTSFEVAVETLNPDWVNIEGTAVSDGAYQDDLTLTKVQGLSVETIGLYAFSRCYNLQYISFPVATVVSAGAFGHCSSLGYVDLPLVEEVKGYAFTECNQVSYISLPECSIVRDQAFNGCDNVEDIYLPKAQIISTMAFAGCGDFSKTIDLPECTQIGQLAFDGCNIVSISLPKCTFISDMGLRNNRFSTISLPKCEMLRAGAFSNNSKLMSVYLLGSSIVSVSVAASWLFSGTPILDSAYQGAYGSIFVPSSLYTGYINAQYWSEMAARVVSM